MKAIIINDVNDADYLARNLESNFRDCLLFSANPSVDIYLKEKFGIKCDCLSKYLSSEDLIGSIERSEIFANEIVDRLDEAYGLELSNKLGLNKIKFFRAVYSYGAYLQLNIYLNLFMVFRIILSQHRIIEEVVFFARKLNDFFATETSIKEILDICGIKNSCITAPYRDDWALRLPRLKKFVAFPRLTFAAILLNLRRRIRKFSYSNIKKNKNTILLFEPLYDLSFLHYCLNKYNVLYYDVHSFSPIGVRNRNFKIPEFSFNFKERVSYDKNDEFNFVKNLIVKDIQSDFENKASDFAHSLLVLDSANKKLGINLGIWGNSPVNGFRSLIFEYLTANNIKVLGCQHGGLFGNRYNDDVFLTDISRCSHYISYGVNKNDLSKVYPKINFDNVKIFPFGTTKIPKDGVKRKKKIDMVFPLNNSMSMYSGGLIREKPEVLTQRQMDLIAYLDSLKRLEIAVKPFVNYNYDNLSVLPLLEKAKNLKVIDYLAFTEMLDRFEIRSVLLENLSTSLYEALPYDLEIFGLHDSVRPIEEGALRLLEKRVHYCTDTNDLIRKVGLFFEGKLEKKRDDSFYSKYIYRPNSQDSVLGIIAELANA